MAFTTKLELRQSHSLVMTPQLAAGDQAAATLQYRARSFVETELERNPLLERDEADESGSAPSPKAPRHEERPES